MKFLSKNPVNVCYLQERKAGDKSIWSVGLYDTMTEKTYFATCWDPAIADYIDGQIQEHGLRAVTYRVTLDVYNNKARETGGKKEYRPDGIVLCDIEVI